jgi:hypothetical protein
MGLPAIAKSRGVGCPAQPFYTQEYLLLTIDNPSFNGIQIASEERMFSIRKRQRLRIEHLPDIAKAVIPDVPAAGPGRCREGAR